MNKKSSKVILIAILSILFLISVAYYVNFVRGWYIGTENYGVKEVTLQDNKLNFKGETISSAQAFSGYKYEIKKDDLYITLRYSLASLFNKSGSVDITIIDNFEQVKNVYLQGREKGDIRLIWTR